MFGTPNNANRGQPTITSFFKQTRSSQSHHVPKRKDLQEQQQQDLSSYLLLPVDNGYSLKDLRGADGRAKVQVNDKEIALLQHRNETYAVQAKCPHSGGPLHMGDIEDIPGCGPCVKCPYHKWTFSLTTGECISPQNRPIAGRLEVFPVKLESDSGPIKLGFTQFSTNLFTTAPE